MKSYISILALYYLLFRFNYSNYSKATSSITTNEETGRIKRNTIKIRFRNNEFVDVNERMKEEERDDRGFIKRFLEDDRLSSIKEERTSQSHGNFSRRSRRSGFESLDDDDDDERNNLLMRRKRRSMYNNNNNDNDNDNKTSNSELRSRLFLITNIKEEGEAFSWRTLDLKLRERNGALIQPVPERSFLAFGTSEMINAIFSNDSFVWVSEMPKETMESFQYDSVCARAGCLTFDVSILPLPFFSRATKAHHRRSNDKSEFAKSVAVELDAIIKEDIDNNSSSTSSSCQITDVVGLSVSCSFTKTTDEQRKKTLFKNIMNHNAVISVLETAETVTHNYNTQSLLQGGNKLVSINRAPLWKLGLSGSNQNVSIIDTGIDKYNCYFSDVKTANANGSWGSKLIDIRSLNGTGGDVIDGTGHGTSVAGVLAGKSGDFFWDLQYDGVANSARIAVTDVGYNEVGIGGVHKLKSLSNVSKSILYEYPMSEFSARVHSNSWGLENSYTYEQTEYEVDSFLNENRDNVVVFSAGNNGFTKPRNSITRPANAKNVLSVGGTKSS